MTESKIPKQEIILLVAGLIALIVLQLIFPRPPFYDEDDYLGNVVLLHQYGFGNNYLLHLAGSAGPLYSTVHFLLEPLTGLHAPYIRLMNTGFLVGVTYFTYRTLCLLSFQNRFYALFVMAIPMTYVVAGLALTEMPAIFFFSIAIYLMIKSMSSSPGKNILLKLITAGMCMGLAILGRQPFLLTLGAVPVLFISKENYKRNLVLLAVTMLSAIALPSYVFFVWKGLVPTIESQLYADIARSGISYRPDFFLLCMFYFFMSLLLIAPGFLRLPTGKNSLLKWGICYITITIANFIFDQVELVPVKPLLVQIFISPGQVHIVSILCGSAVIFSALYLLVCIYKNVQSLGYPKELVFFTVASLLIAVACAKITWGFSSRYAAQAVPLLVLMGSYTYRNSKYNLAGILVGMLVGLISLFLYLTGP